MFIDASPPKSSMLKFLERNATFKGVSLEKLTSKTGEEYQVLTVTFDVEGYGDFKHSSACTACPTCQC